MGVRLWNLWPAGGPHSVTWHIEELTVVGIRKDGSPADDVPIHWVEVRDVAPGAVVDSGLQTLTWKQRGAMASDTHMAVLVKAHLGDAKQTPLLFSVPIPNGYALIKQTSGLDVTGPTANSEGNCRTGGGCAFSGEVAFYRNPLAQRVTGTIELKATELDTLGRNAAIDPAVLTAMHDDTRIAQVMLFAWPRDAAHQDLVPVQAVLSKLTLTGSNLKQVAPGRWVREDKAPDEADGPIGFTADLQLSEFYFADKGISIFDAHRASGSVYVGITTTSGSFQVQRLILWPLRSKLPMAQLLIPACNLSVPRTTAIDLAEDRAICTIGGSTGSCMGHYQRVQTIFADWGGGATEPPGNDIFTLGLAVGGGSNNCRPITFVGAPVNLSASSMRPADCDLNAIAASWPAGNGQAVCDYVAPSGMALFSTQNFDFSGSTCPTSGPQKLPYRVTYKRLFPPLLVEGLKKTFGWKDAPAEWTFDIQ